MTLLFEKTTEARTHEPCWDLLEGKPLNVSVSLWVCILPVFVSVWLSTALRKARTAAVCVENESEG